MDRLLIEAKASGISVAQELRRLYAGEGWGIQTVDPKGDKMARVYAVQPIFADEMVYAPARAWAAMVQNDMADFPRGAHDDLTDSATQALRWLRDNGFLRRGEEVGPAQQHAAGHDVGAHLHVLCMAPGLHDEGEAHEVALDGCKVAGPTSITFAPLTTAKAWLGRMQVAMHL